jgi:nucleotide-binding universal stress UspA family protein
LQQKLNYGQRSNNVYKKILVALDGSEPSRYAGQAAIGLALATRCHVTACHVYGVDIHRRRFSDMEPGLPVKYQQENTLTDLRTAHNRLILEGLRALSKGYVEDFMAACEKKGVTAESVAIEGRSYTGILHLAKERKSELILLGANGLGAIGDNMLGGTLSRVLYNAPCDLLVTHRAPHNGPILTGLDGSEEALKAVAGAIALGRAMKKHVHIVAAYDPNFHTQVFGTVARSLSPERQEEFGLIEQERLHNEIINEGLEKLYAGFLREAEHRFHESGVWIRTSLMTGKAYHALNSYAESSGVDLIVVSRHGNHRQPHSILGSNAESLLRTTKANVLIVGGVATNNEKQEAGLKSAILSKVAQVPPQMVVWDPDAEADLQRVPVFVRGMAKRAIEDAVLKTGKQRVSSEDFDNVAAQFGMGHKRSDT